MNQPNRQHPAAARVTVMSYNIRYNTPDDGPNAWQHRRDRVAATILKQRPDVLGVQEALYPQMRDLLERLEGYQCYGVGRDDGRTGGEHMGIFYRPARLQLEDVDSFWLSPTPSYPSRGWDAVCTRCTSWVKFHDKATGRPFLFCDTHLDHAGPIAKSESAKLVIERIPAIADRSPFVLVGDFNITPASEPMQLLLAARSADGLPIFRDARNVSQRPHEGPDLTFQGFSLASPVPVPRIIDYILVSQGIEVLRHACIGDNDGETYPSDHVPLVAEIAL